MKTLFIEAQKKQHININSINLKNLPQKIFLAYSIQYKPLALEIKKKLKELGNQVSGFQQVLGCTKLKSIAPVLLIGSGRFHALNLTLQDNQVFLLEGNKIRKFEEKETEKLKQKTKAAKTRFLSADTIGILVSCKPGQEQLSRALKLKKKLEKQGKSVFLFLTDRIDFTELENYNIDSWVNTACPGLIFDSPDSRIINIGEI